MSDEDDMFFIEGNSVNALLYSKVNDEYRDVMIHMQNEILILHRLIEELKEVRGVQRT